MMGIASVALETNLGALVIDEIQFLLEARRGSLDEILSFLTRFVSVVRAPVVFMGTHARGVCYT
jgi:hypothetical protein